MTQYDGIAEAYTHSDTTIIKQQIIKPVFLQMVGDVAGKRILDLACGSGFSTRPLAEAGANVVGIDISAEEIALAREKEEQHPLGIEYHIGDVAHFDLSSLGEFDLATAVFLLPYAKSRAALNAMCRNVAGCLSDGGRFINVLPNPNVPVITSSIYQLTATMATPGEEGTIRTLTYHPEGKDPTSFDQYYWARGTYASALAGAGFRNVAWIEFAVPQSAIDLYGSDFWTEYQASPHQVGLVAEL